MSPGLSSNANNEKIASFVERDLSNLRGRDQYGHPIKVSKNPLSKSTNDPL
jgi:hypothetical protein